MISGPACVADAAAGTGAAPLLVPLCGDDIVVVAPRHSLLSNIVEKGYSKISGRLSAAKV